MEVILGAIARLIHAWNSNRTKITDQGRGLLFQ